MSPRHRVDSYVQVLMLTAFFPPVMFLVFHRREENLRWFTDRQRYKDNPLFQLVLQIVKKKKKNNWTNSGPKMNFFSALASRNPSFAWEKTWLTFFKLKTLSHAKKFLVVITIKD